MPKFTVESGEIRVSDPCYDRDTWCNFSIKAKKGEWNAFVELKDLGSWGERVGSIVAEHSKPGKLSKPKTQTIGVDSGQAGIFDDKYFKDDSSIEDVKRIHSNSICEDEPWYSICCDRTLSKNQWGVIPFGVVSSSGVGDGCYEVTYYTNKKGEAVRIEILFLCDELCDEFK
jgi:hypothetical protein